MRLVQRMMELLEEKGAAVAARSAGPGGELSTREIANFWLLHGINPRFDSAAPPVDRQARAPGGAVPRAVKAGGSTVHVYPGVAPGQPALVRSPEPQRLLRKTRSAYTGAPGDAGPTNVVSIPLTGGGGLFLRRRDQRPEMSRPFQVGVSIQADDDGGGNHESRAAADQGLQPAFCARAGRRALPGLAMTHLPIPPPAVSTHRETQYFGLSRGGPCWDHMVSTRKIGVYVPGEFPTPEVEILVVLDN